MLAQQEAPRVAAILERNAGLQGGVRAPRLLDREVDWPSSWTRNASATRANVAATRSGAAAPPQTGSITSMSTRSSSRANVQLPSRASASSASCS